MKKVVIALAALLIAILAVGFAVWYLVFAPTPAFLPARDVIVNKGDSLRIAADKLAKAAVIRNALAFVVYADLTGQADRIQPGYYSFKGGESAAQVLRHLVNGDFVVIKVTIPEGMTVHQIGEKLEQAGLVCDNKFDAAARDGALVKALGLGPLGAEGFLFPATYEFSPLATTNQILGTMLKRFFTIITPEVEQRMFKMGLNLRQLVTMASIIEKEAKVPGERPIIASVFYNRLKIGMPLQSDPTAQYNFSGESIPALQAVRTDSAFNTYDFVGLPPGPIANPGLSSIRAALYPAHTDYLYFVARGDGTHVFSRSFGGQKRAIAEIQRKEIRNKSE